MLFVVAYAAQSLNANHIYIFSNQTKKTPT